MKIATHNSGTGYPAFKWYHKLLIPFSKTQSKNISSQLRNKCTYFDIRIKEQHKKDSVVFWNICHGLWRSKTTLSGVLSDISIYLSLNLKNVKHEDIYIMITYEGKSLPIEEEDFINQIKKQIDTINSFYPSTIYAKIILTEVNIKKPKWRNIYRNPDAPSYIQGYKNLDGSSWHTYLPIPWLWNKIYGDHNFNDDVYKFVDFL
jgi:hypothetical protein